MDTINKFIKSFNSVVKTVSIVFISITLLAMIAPISALLESSAIIFFGIKFIKNTITSLIKGIKVKDLKATT
jgi:hypothetical protein